ncbi:MAG TPA: VWA domain-containing protein [Candidatus Acidoferrales bacterium]|nr:VWA domain-containing protein [Candidatus Acidoferrales bacterium]
MFAFAVALFIPHLAHAQTKSANAKKLPRARQLDQHVLFEREASSGELRVATSGADTHAQGSEEVSDRAIQVVTQMVAVTCSVFTTEGDPVPGLTRGDFRIYDNGVAQQIAYFDASTQPASVALIIDASPSVLRDTDEMKRAASALVDALAPLDQAAVADFSAHTYLQLPFSDVRELIRRAVARVDPRQLLGDTGGSNIYEAVYLVARDLFPGRTGRKSIVLLTDGQDSGLGLTLDPTTASPRPGLAENRLTFDDVTRLLASEDIQLFAVSTEPRPGIMTADWLASHAVTTLLTSASRRENIPPDTLYLAELVRRAGGQLYFLHDKETLADTFRDIASKIRAEYTLGFYPAAGSASASPSAAADGITATPSATAATASGWHQLRVDLPDQADARPSYRSSYFVSP